jgi:hypothetical protein
LVVIVLSFPLYHCKIDFTALPSQSSFYRQKIIDTLERTQNQTCFEVMWFLLDLHSGALSHGEEFINVYKTHPDLFNSKDFALYKQIKVPVPALL